MQMAVTIKQCIALTIMPLLAPTSDHESKIKLTLQDERPVLSYHVDEFCQLDIMHDIHDQLLTM